MFLKESCVMTYTTRRYSQRNVPVCRCMSSAFSSTTDRQNYTLDTTKETTLYWSRIAPYLHSFKLNKKCCFLYNRILMFLLHVYHNVRMRHSNFKNYLQLILKVYKSWEIVYVTGALENVKNRFCIGFQRRCGKHNSRYQIPLWCFTCTLELADFVAITVMCAELCFKGKTFDIGFCK